MVRRKSKRGWKHVWSYVLAKLVLYTAWLSIGDDGVEEIAKDWERGLGSVGICHDDCVLDEGICGKAQIPCLPYTSHFGAFQA
jgi:hypothetical protein